MVSVVGMHVMYNFLSAQHNCSDDGPKDSKSLFESDGPTSSVFGCTDKKLSVAVTFCTCFVLRQQWLAYNFRTNVHAASRRLTFFTLHHK